MLSVLKVEVLLTDQDEKHLVQVQFNSELSLDVFLQIGMECGNKAGSTGRMQLATHYTTWYGRKTECNGMYTIVFSLASSCMAETWKPFQEQRQPLWVPGW